MNPAPNNLDISTTEFFSEKFFKIVVGSVNFDNFAPDDTGLRYRIVRLAALGQPAEATEFARANSSLSPEAAKELIQRIEAAADRAFYATGLRPVVGRSE